MMACKGGDKEQISSDALTVIIFSVTALEAFLNGYFSMEANQLSDMDKRQKISKMINGKNNIKDKMKKMPRLCWGKSIESTSEWYEWIKKAIEIRHKAVHPKPDCHTFKQGDIVINGLSDVSVFKELDADFASNVLESTIVFVQRMGEFSGLGQDELKFHLTRWTGHEINNH